MTCVSANFFFEDDMGRVEGKTAVITAAGQGIGRARFMMMIMTTMMTIMRRRRKRAYRYQTCSHDKYLYPQRPHAG